MDELIRKQDALDALSKLMVPYGDGSFPGDDGKIAYDETIFEAIIVLENLPPVQPTQPNCEYCHTDRDGYVFPLEKNSHAFIDRDKIVLKAKGWRGEAKIKYCPICGRRLTDG